MTVRGYGRASRRGGGNPPLQRALRKFGFFAPLTEDVFLDRGYGAASFTRATVATVKDHEGAIRNCVSGEVRFHGQRRNENQIRRTAYSSEDASAWTGSVSGTLSSGVADPEGGTSAFTVTATGAFQSWAMAAPALTGQSVLGSIWLRRRTGTGTVLVFNGGASSATTDVTSVLTTSWQRFSLGVVTSGATGFFGPRLATSGDAVDFWHPHLENVTGQANQNPSEYVSVGAAKLNELLYTEELDNASWTKASCTVTANQVAGPFGAGVVADLVIQSITASATHYLYATSPSTIASGVAMVGSVYAKKGPGATAPDWIQVCFSGALGVSAYANFNLTTGAVGSSTGCTASIVDAGGGWYRLVVALSTTSSTTASLVVAFTNNNDGLGRVPSYVVAAATADVYLFGAQLERASSAGTYFPVGSVYPYHGACVDGVKYFSTQNGNTVASNVVTEATGAAITRPENDGLTNALVLGGQTSGNSASAPDSVPLSVTGDMEIEVDFHRPGINGNLTSKSSDSCATHGWELLFSSTPKVYLKWFDGTATRSASPVAAWPYSTTTRGQVKVVLDVDNGAGGCAVSYYYRPDSLAAWTLLETVTQAFTTSIVDSAQPVYIGAQGGQVGIGEFYRVVIRNGIDGTTVFDADFTAQELGATSFTESSANAALVTVNRSGTVPAYIGNPLRVFNYEGYLAESARTNLVLQSSNLGTTWAVGGTPTRSAAAAYCGEIALDLIGDTDAGALAHYSQALTFTADASKSVSFLVKQGTSTSAVARLHDSTAPANRLLVAITWSGGVPICTYTTGSAERASEYMGSGVWRIFCLTASVVAANTNTLYFYAATDAVFAVTGTGDIYIGGVQAENATTASASHIPTTTATVTRNGDDLRYPMAGNANSAGANSVYVEHIPLIPSSQNKYLLALNESGGGANEMFAVTGGGVGDLVSAFVYDGGVSQANMSGGSVVFGTANKAAAAAALNDVAISLNGGTVATDATATMPVVNSLAVGQDPNFGGSQPAQGLVRSVRVAASRVSNADLQLITQ